MYCTLEDIKAHMPDQRLIEVTDDVTMGEGGTINEEIVAASIKESSVLIDSMIGSKYLLPLPSTPPILNNICIDFSIYNLYERLMSLQDNPGMRKRYDNAMKLLRMIADGDILLGVPMASESPGFFASSFVEGGPAQFTMNSMRNL
jgi:phage gp36-like protein